MVIPHRGTESLLYQDWRRFAISLDVFLKQSAEKSADFSGMLRLGKLVIQTDVFMNYVG